VFKKIMLAVFLVVALSTVAFAGEGSDTLGACKLMPELRYSYFETPTNGDTFAGGLDWEMREHDAIFQLSWGALNNLDLYAFVGGRICAEVAGFYDDGVNTHEIVFDVGEGVTTGLGVRGTFWRSSGCFYVGGGASFTYAQTHGKRGIKMYENGVVFWDSLPDGGVYFNEQHFSVTADLHAGWNFAAIGLTPYLGVEYRWINDNVTTKNIGTPVHSMYVFREKYPVGVYVGLDYLIANRLNLNLEGHMINRWGGSVGVGYVFDICGAPEAAPVAPAPAPVIEPKLEPMSKN
jgi:hypothetical protein